MYNFTLIKYSESLVLKKLARILRRFKEILHLGFGYLIALETILRSRSY